VQVAAFKTRDAADNAVASLKQLGYGAFTTTDGGYLKVRAGPFASKAQAQAAVEPIRQRLKGQPFVTRATVP
jgi:cell division septation protein DedD